MKPRCSFCGRDIKANEHYWVVKRGVFCRECSEKIPSKKNEVCNVGTDADSSSKDSN